MQHDIKKVKETLTDAQIEERRAAAHAFRDVLQVGFQLRDEWRATKNGNNQTGASPATSSLEQITEKIQGTQKSLESIAPLLEKNPDCYSIFVFRRELFAHLKELMLAQKVLEKKLQEAQDSSSAPAAEATAESKETTDEDKKNNQQQQQLLLLAQFDGLFSKEVLVPELKFNTAIIKRDYKSYAAWVHRRWALNAMHPKVRIAVLQEEHSKLDQLLAQDERNFHAWGYRRWVTSELAGAGLYDDDKELAFAAAKIQNNFSNYSAWHNRALVLWKRVDAYLLASSASASSSSAASGDDSAVAAICTQVNQDCDMLCNAFYCDPNDQSAFIYCKALVEKIHSAATQRKDNRELNQCNAAMQSAVLSACRELAEEEKSCAWPRYLLLCLPLRPLPSREAEIAAWQEMQQLDPTRQAYFAEKIAKVSSTSN